MSTPTTSIELDYPGGIPNPAQARAHALAPYAEEILYGGSAGGGKTDFELAYVLYVLFRFPGANALLLRKTFPQLALLGGIIQRLRTRIPSSVGTYNESKHLWSFRNGPGGGTDGGSRLQLGHLSRGDADLSVYLGGEYAIIGIDQAEDFSGHQIVMLAHRLRVGGELGRRMRAEEYSPQLLLSANPGGLSHSFLKERFVDPFPLGCQVFRPPATLEEPTPRTRVFIPARVTDNVANVGEEYVRVLNALPEMERRALRDGDWNVYAGQRFNGFTTATHVKDPGEVVIPIGSGVARAMGIDYGMDNPFTALWIARMDVIGGLHFEDPVYVVYREVDGAGLTPAEQAQLILASEVPGEWGGQRRRACIDPSTWARLPDTPSPARTAGSSSPLVTTGPPAGSIAATYRKNGVHVRKADNRRLERAALFADLMRVRPDGWPRLVITSNCPNLIRTLPLLQRDPRRPEDVLKCDIDHWYDGSGYGLMEIAGMRPVHSVEPPAVVRARAQSLGSTLPPSVMGLRGLRGRGL